MDTNIITIPADENGVGSIQIADDVVAMIASLAATEIDGVSSMVGNITNELMGKVGMKKLTKGVIAYQNFMDQAAERAGGDFFILPSSIHELLIVPDNGQMGLRDLEAMVREVNATQVAPEDKLTDSVYHYDSKEKIFELGEKFVERQAEKEAAMDKEASEKSSVIGELKAKKEEIDKQPKKDAPQKAAKSKGEEL